MVRKRTFMTSNKNSKKSFDKYLRHWVRLSPILSLTGENLTVRALADLKYHFIASERMCSFIEATINCSIGCLFSIHWFHTFLYVVTLWLVTNPNSQIKENNLGMELWLLSRQPDIYYICCGSASAWPPPDLFGRGRIRSNFFKVINKKNILRH